MIHLSTRQSRPRHGAIRRRPLFLSLSLTLVLVASIGGFAAGSPAIAVSTRASVRTEIPGGFGSWAELWGMQQKINDALREIRAAADAIGSDGYGGAYAAPENRELRLYWHGPMPAAVAKVVEAQRQIVPVRVLPAKYSKKLLDAEVQRIGAEVRAAGLNVAEVGPKTDGSGVLVLMRSKGSAPSARASSALRSVSVDIEIDDAADRASALLSKNRRDDKPLYQAGARTDECTTGFAVWRQGRSMLLSAAHCYPAGASVLDGGGDLVGRVVDRSEVNDTLIIDAGARGRMWDGGLNSTVAQSVSGVATSGVGNLLCTSGSRSGVICGVRVDAVDVMNPDTGFYPQVRAHQVDGRPAAGQGDSGGPVFSNTPEAGHVSAMGLISSGDGAVVPCQGEQNRDCYNTIYYSDVVTALGRYGASILTYRGTGSSTRGDFDGEGRAEAAVWRPSTGNWHIAHNTGGTTTFQWGFPADIPVPGDYDGDGRYDAAVWRPSTVTWWLARSAAGVRTVAWGSAGDRPVPADYDGDGRTDIAVWRPSNGTWHIVRSDDGGVTTAQWGQSGDVPVPGDYDGDGRAEAAVWRPSTGNWHIAHNNGTRTTFQWGFSADTPVPGDYDEDGRVEPAVWRPSTGDWWIANGQGVVVIQWGIPNDIPRPGDYDGDGRFEPAVWRPSTGVWHVRHSGGGVTVFGWGLPGDIPVT
jgi:hypothetical protein